MRNDKITAADEPLLMEWLNCREVSVDADGDIWVSDPMRGHWLDAASKAKYIEWRASR